MTVGTWRADARARLEEVLAVREAQAKLRAMTGADAAQIEQMIAQAQRFADSLGAPLSAALEVVAEQVAYPKPPDPLAELRAEVERLRDGVDDRFSGTGWQPHEYRLVTDAYDDVLDLIDKRTAPVDEHLHAGVDSGHYRRPDCPCGPKFTHFESDAVAPCDIWMHQPLDRRERQ